MIVLLGLIFKSWWFVCWTNGTRKSNFVQLFSNS